MKPAVVQYFCDPCINILVWRLYCWSPRFALSLNIWRFTWLYTWFLHWKCKTRICSNPQASEIKLRAPEKVLPTFQFTELALIKMEFELAELHFELLGYFHGYNGFKYRLLIHKNGENEVRMYYRCDELLEIYYKHIYFLYPRWISWLFQYKFCIWCTVVFPRVSIWKFTLSALLVC